MAGVREQRGDAGWGPLDRIGPGDRIRRFCADARALLGEMRAAEPEGSDGWKAITAAMAITALRGGEMARFNSHAAELDARSGDGYEIDHGGVEVITLHRALKDGRLPDNARARVYDYLQTLARPTAAGGK